MSPPIHVTESLLAVLLELAADAEPRAANVPLVATAAGDLVPRADRDGEWAERAGDGERAERDAPAVRQLADVAPETPVFSDFYFPDVGRSLDFVFGVDLGTPAGQTHGRFLSHPEGDPELSVRDDLHATVLVAVPPWTPASVTAFDRDSTEREILLVAARSPEPARGGATGG
ncbi:MAG: hypothetical protein ABEJ60_06395 [Halodesulfurarchaeum sp.]